MSTLTGKQLESFPGFSEFPPVVRKLIWERALPDGRVVNLRSYNPLVLPEVEEDEVEVGRKLLIRLETSANRATLKKLPEIVFQMLYGHECYMSHGTWTVFCKKLF